MAKGRYLGVRKRLELEKPAVMNGDGHIEFSQTDETAGSYQIIAADLELGADSGTSEAGDTDFKAPIMGNVMGEDLAKLHNYIAGVIGALSVLGTRATLLPMAALLGVLMDGAVNGDGIVTAHIDGSDPSTETHARAAFAVSQFNDNAATSVEYGLDLKYDPPAGLDALFSSETAQPFKISKGLLRSPSDVVILEGAGVPSDGTTGDNFAGSGSLYIDITNAEAYIQTSLITTPVWKKITRAA